MTIEIEDLDKLVGNALLKKAVRTATKCEDKELQLQRGKENEARAKDSVTQERIREKLKNLQDWVSACEEAESFRTLLQKPWPTEIFEGSPTTEKAVLQLTRVHADNPYGTLSTVFVALINPDRPTVALLWSFPFSGGELQERAVESLPYSPLKLEEELERLCHHPALVTAVVEALP